MSRLTEEKSKLLNEPKIYNYYNKPEQVEEVNYVGAYFKRKQPTVQTKQESSMPSKKPSMTTCWLAAPNFLLASISVSAVFASSKSWMMSTPFPAASPSAFST